MKHMPVLRIVLLFIVLELLVLAGLFATYTSQQQRYLAGDYAEFERRYHSAVETYETVSKVVFAEIINKPQVISLVSRAGTVSGAEQERFRSELRVYLQSTYKNLLQYQLNQIHFHQPDLKSFLRMHRPAVYGDDLTHIRPAVVLANQKREYVSGFEIGRHEAGFRFIFPLFDQQRFIGTVETSVQYNTFQEQLSRRYPGEYALLIKKSVVDNRILDKDKYSLVISPFSKQLMQERFMDTRRSRYISSEEIHALASGMHERIERLLANARPAYLAATVNGRSYAVNILPLTNVARQTEAYLLLISRDRTLETIRQTHALSCVVATLLVLLVCVFFYLTSRRKQQAQETNRILHAAINALPYPFQIVDVADFRIKLANSSAYKDGQLPEGLTCHQLSHASAQPCSDALHPCPIKQAVATGKATVVEHLHRNEAGEERTMEVHGYPITDTDGVIRQCIEYAVDITERKQMEHNLIKLADTDSLTGIYNRRKCYELLAGELQRAARHGRHLALLMIDLDHFKRVNDTFGHDVGDTALKHVVQVMGSVVRISDILARTGGEEFMLVAPETDLHGADALADKLLKSVRSQACKGVGAISISVGIATWQNGDTLDALVRRADQALFRAKRKGRDRVETG